MPSGVTPVEKRALGEVTEAAGAREVYFIPKALHEKRGIPVNVADDPLSSVVRGSKKALDSIDILRQVMI